MITQAGSALQVTARPEGKDLPVNRSTKVVSKVKATGKVVVKTACQVNGVQGRPTLQHSGRDQGRGHRDTHLQRPGHLLGADHRKDQGCT
ncbi:MAG: hypothetical protein V9E98_14440 [Candidatus Nanopelagicales bacterium]